MPGQGTQLILTEAVRRKLKLGPNFTVFLLFFGIAMLEAFQTRNWIKASIWLAISIVFLLADNLKKDERV